MSELRVIVTGGFNEYERGFIVKAPPGFQYRGEVFYHEAESKLEKLVLKRAKSSRLFWGRFQPGITGWNWGGAKWCHSIFEWDPLFREWVPR
jgi:hypothetical protein